MCGIAGAAGFSTQPPVTPETLAAMLATIRHRGPDDEGAYFDDHVALGMRRLSIIDVAGGHQPIANEDETCWVVLNGEIFNYRELRAQLLERGHQFRTHTDTEVIVHAYEEWGEACPEQLNGQFAFAIWDKPRQRLFLARDRVGIKPLYYTEAAGNLIFGSELRVFLTHPAVPRELDLAAVDAYLTYEHVPAPLSIIRGVAKLPPGCTLTYDGPTGARVNRYWDVDLSLSETGEAKSEGEWTEMLADTFRRSVRMELVSDVPLGVFLSGGLDSSAIAALMMQEAGGSVQSFSIAFEDASFDESPFARQVASHLGTLHRQEVLSQQMMWDLVPQLADILDEPLGDSSVIPSYLLSRFARRHVTVALGGDGGDELFAGYSTLQAHRLTGYYNRVPGLLRHLLIGPLVNALPVSHNNLSFDFKAKRFVQGADEPVHIRHHQWLGSFTQAEKAALYRPEVAAALKGQDALDMAAAYYRGSRATSELNRVLHMDMKLYLESDILMKVDRASMANSLEARVPFLNLEMLELANQVPIELKLKGFTRKYLLRRIMKGVLPENIINRPKKGFNIPVAKWFRHELKGLLLDTLSRDRVQRQGLFRYEAVEVLLSQHFSGKRDNRKQLWTLLVLQLWYDRWITPQAAKWGTPSNNDY
ncbi:MAG: asparagine synthase (glutamine-hydrolyzing) [Dehalococcoidia bacterium]|nr:asparagine synthase (glutamine-hydrolyzing) [Dehalococcoidia bacterium]